jgi:hypothetical protein
VHDRRVIRDAVLHIENEQPLLGDLYRLPEPTDVGLLCTNVRMLDGRRPIFIDHIESSFFFPYRIIRFIEIPAASAGGSAAGDGADRAGTEDGDDAMTAATLVGVAEADLELDEDFLRRVKEI